MNAQALILKQVLPSAAATYWPASSSKTAVQAASLPIGQITADSRKVRPGDLFVAISGVHVDGHAFVADAVARGAIAIVAERPLADIQAPLFVVPSSAAAFAEMTMAAAVGHACPIVNVGITGTNGKTTTAWMLRSMMQAAGLRTGLVGTIERSIGTESEQAQMTTPSADQLAQHMRQLMQQRASHNVLEISSHALDQQRCAAIKLGAAGITNVTHDHFDYHQTMDAYRAAKARIAQLLHADAPLLLNIDDAGCQFILDRMVGSSSVITCGIHHPEAELQASVLHKTHRSQRLRLKLAQGDAEVRLRLIGQHNVANSLMAAGLAEQLGIRLKHIVEGLESLQHVPGRLERIDAGQPFQVLVDYAHTADALSRCLTTIRDFVPGRLICVFGAGGDRDHSKRPLMGEAAAAADFCIVTSDNPRSEDPAAIIREVTAGFPLGTQFTTRLDRRDALALACAMAEPGDVVLIAGKGHETVQEIGNQRLPFDDREVMREFLKRYSGNRNWNELQSTYSLSKSA